jgi:hypothetical protein
MVFYNYDVVRYRGNKLEEHIFAFVVFYSNYHSTITNVPDLGPGALLAPGSEIGKNQKSGSGINNPDYIS